MNHDLSLSLELLEQAAWGFRFRLTVRNGSAARLLLPFPEIHGLGFGNTATMREAEWYTGLLVSTAAGGFTLEPGELRAIEWPVRPCDVERPEEDDGSDYYRWCVELPPGEYLAWFRWQVNRQRLAPRYSEAIGPALCGFPVHNYPEETVPASSAAAPA